MCDFLIIKPFRPIIIQKGQYARLSEEKPEKFSKEKKRQDLWYYS